MPTLVIINMQMGFNENHDYEQIFMESFNEGGQPPFRFVGVTVSEVEACNYLCKLTLNMSRKRY